MQIEHSPAPAWTPAGKRVPQRGTSHPHLRLVVSNGELLGPRAALPEHGPVFQRALYRERDREFIDLALARAWPERTHAAELELEPGDDVALLVGVFQPDGQRFQLELLIGRVHACSETTLGIEVIGSPGRGRLIPPMLDHGFGLGERVEIERACVGEVIKSTRR